MEMNPADIVQNVSNSGQNKTLHVSEFYRDSVVLVTGGTGFLGKVLVEKLLRSFDVKKIFLLIREKRGVSSAQRLQQMICDPVSIVSGYYNYQLELDWCMRKFDAHKPMVHWTHGLHDVARIYQTGLWLMCKCRGAIVWRVLESGALRKEVAVQVRLTVMKSITITCFLSDEINKHEIFDTIRASVIHPNKIFEKLVAIDTDFSSPEFVKEPYKSDLLNETQVVFHVMASIRFDLGFQHVMDTNVTGTEKLYNFLRNASRLQAIVHVSTFFSNCDRSHIEECVYDDIRFGGWDNIRRILEPLTESEKNNLMPTMIAPLPNNYSFSKKCAEVMIQQQFSDLPVGIFRPPIVTPSYKEPIPGWVDCIQGVTGLCIPILKQQLLWYYGEPTACPAFTPVDYCIAGMITAACDINARYEENRVLESFDRHVTTLPVYNFTFDKSPITWQQFVGLVGSSLPTVMGRKLSALRNRLTRWRILSRITFWLMYFMAYIGDMILSLCGKPKSNVSLVSILQALADAVESFVCNTWTARTDSVKRMRSSLSKGDKALLEFDLDRIEMEDYFKQYTNGLLSELERRELRKRQKMKLESSVNV